jgi:hypothetical protein
MKIVIKMPIAGHAEPMYSLPEFSYRPGELVEIDDTLAGHWIASGIAEAAPDIPQPEDKPEEEKPPHHGAPTHYEPQSEPTHEIHAEHSARRSEPTQTTHKKPPARA